MSGINYKYGNCKIKDLEVDKAIKEYMKTLWVNIECEECPSTTNVKYDTETSRNICSVCLKNELRIGIEVLVETGFLK